jgi:hypothetical protein
LNYLFWARLSRSLMIWLHAYPPLPTYPFSKLEQRRTEKLRKSDNLLAEEAWSRIIRPKESLVIYYHSILCDLHSPLVYVRLRPDLQPSESYLL